MPKVMLRRDRDTGAMTLYVAKQDLEENVVAVQHAGPAPWGGELQLADGSKYFIEPMESEPSFPITVRAKRI